MRSVLRLSQLFSHLGDTTLDEIGSTASRREIKADQVIFQEGDPAVAFFIVGSGKVKVFKLSSDGKEQILMLAQPGDSFAEAAMFGGGRFPASAQALTNTELLVFDRSRFASLLGRNPDLALNLIARLSELLRKMTYLVEGLSLSDVNTRLARYLIGYAKEKDGRISYEITLAEKKGVLAAQLGTIPETLSRALAKMAKDGLIRVDGPKISVLDPRALEELAESGR